jgi:hypothetical protein
MCRTHRAAADRCCIQLSYGRLREPLGTPAAWRPSRPRHRPQRVAAAGAAIRWMRKGSCARCAFSQRLAGATGQAAGRPALENCGSPDRSGNCTLRLPCIHERARFRADSPDDARPTNAASLAGGEERVPRPVRADTRFRDSAQLPPPSSAPLVRSFRTSSLGRAKRLAETAARGPQERSDQTPADCCVRWRLSLKGLDGRRQRRAVGAALLTGASWSAV